MNKAAAMRLPIARLALGYAYGAIGLFSIALAFFGSKGLALMLFCGAIAAFTGYVLRFRALPTLEFKLTALLILFIAWAALTSLWADEQMAAFAGALKLGGLFLAGLYLVAAARGVEPHALAIVRNGLRGGLALGAGLLLIEITLNGPIYYALINVRLDTYANGAFWLNAANVLLILLAWPALMSVKPSTRLITTIVALAALMFYAISLRHFTAVVAIGLGGAVALAVWAQSRKIAAFVAAGVIVGSLAFPITIGHFADEYGTIDGQPSISNTVQHRYAIWSFVSDRIAEHPLIGWGMNASKTVPHAHDKIWIGNNEAYVERLPLHPHNLSLQTWLELGLPGLILLIVAEGLIIHRILASAVHRTSVALALGQFTAALTFASLSYGLWQAWWIATLWIAASLSVAMLRDESAP